MRNHLVKSPASPWPPRVARWGVLWFVALACASTQEPAHAQASEAAVPTLEQLALDVFTVEDGLPSAVVLAVERTPDGYLWVGTANGLARFDGVEFTVFNARNMPHLTSGWVEHLEATDDGSLWIAPRDGGLIRYRDGYTTRYGAAEGLTNPVTALSQGQDGILWIGTAQGQIHRFEGERISAESMPSTGGPSSVRDIAQDASGALWLTSPEEGVYRYERGNWTLFDRDGSFEGRAALEVAQDTEGTVWVSTGLPGLFRFEQRGFSAIDLPRFDTAPASRLGALLTDRQGGVWAGARGQDPAGIIRLHGESVERMIEANGLPDRRILDLFEDDGGSIWIGTYGGLARLRRGQFLSFAFPGAAKALLQTSDGRLWAGGTDGLWQVGMERGAPVLMEHHIRDRQVWSLAEDSAGNVWAATSNGLVRTDGLETRVFTTADGLPHDRLMFVVAGASGDVWVGFDPQEERGVGRVVDGTFEAVEGLEELRLGGLFTDLTGRLWLDDLNEGLAVWDGSRLTAIGRAGGSRPVQAVGFHQDEEGEVWIGTRGAGVLRVRGDSVTSYGTAEGMPTDSPLSVLDDGAGRLWFGTDDGIFRVRKQHLDDFDAGRIETIPSTVYAARDGLRNPEAESRGFPSTLRTEGGRLWFTMVDGLVAVVAPGEEPSPAPPPVHIDEFAIGNEVVLSASRIDPLPDGLPANEPRELPLGVRDVEISYSATELARPDEVRFRFRLVGLHEDWVDAEDRRFMRFEALPPGEYEFRVEASAGNDAWSEESARVAFTLPAYFYESTWFAGLAVLLATTAVYGGYRFRTRRLARQAVQLQTLVAQRDARSAELERAVKEVSRLKNRLEEENVYLREEITASHGFDEIIGNSRAIRGALGQVEQVARTDSTVLLLGETGTGKELMARAVHNRSFRRQRPLVKVDCASLPGSLIESELFGHEKGAFTGAGARRRGRFEIADGGTVFLDEIGDLDPGLQTKLLRVLQEGEFERVGGTKTLRVDVRVIAATNRNLQQAVASGAFRSDLYYRLNVVPIEVPPLRERQEDISSLVWHFLDRYANQLGKSFDGVPASLMDALKRYEWPGNVRELQNVIERATVLSTGPLLNVDKALGSTALPAAGEGAAGTASDGALTADKTLEQVEREYIVCVLEQSGWKVKGRDGAAETLGLKESSLRYKMKKLGIQRPKST